MKLSRKILVLLVAAGMTFGTSITARATAENNTDIIASGSMATVKVAGPTLTPDGESDIVIAVGQIAKAPQNSQSVTWRSCDTSIVSINEQGYMVALKEGQTSIISTSTDGIETKYTVTIVSPTGLPLLNTSLYSSYGTKVNQPIDSIDLLPSIEYMDVGKTAVLLTVVSPPTFNNSGISWSSTSPSIATVNSAGIITAKKAGTCRIIAKAADGSDKSDMCTIVVKQPATSIALSETSLTIAKGYNKTIVANITPCDVSSQNIAWSSSDNTIATIDDKGVITAIKEGSCKIMAKTTDGSNKTAICDIRVAKPVQEINLNENKIVLNTNKQTTFKPTITADKESNTTVVYTSDNSKIATIDNDGLLTAISPGICTITCSATDGSGKTDTCKVEVRQQVSKITISGENTVREDEKITLKANISPKNATNKEVKWSSDDNSIAKVDKNGIVTGISPGKTTIKCVAKDDSSKSASYTITVKKAVSTGQKIAEYANSWVGKTQYVWGGNKLETGVDCSGFICDIYSRFGYNLWYARTTLYTTGREISLSEAKPGDIVTYPGHVALYIGNGMVTHAANENYDVVTTSIDWCGQYTHITRVL